MKPIVDARGVVVGATVVAAAIALPLLERNLITRSEIRKIAEHCMTLDMPISPEQREQAQQMIDGFLFSIQADDPPEHGAPLKPKPDWLKIIIEGGKDGEST